MLALLGRRLQSASVSPLRRFGVWVLQFCTSKVIVFVFLNLSLQGVCVCDRPQFYPVGQDRAWGKRFAELALVSLVSAGPEQKEANFFFFFFLRQTNRKHIDGNVAIAHGVALTGRPRRPSVKSEEAEARSSHDCRPHSRPNTPCERFWAARPWAANYPAPPLNAHTESFAKIVAR